MFEIIPAPVVHPSPKRKLNLLELAQGKSAIVVGSEDNLIPTINMLIEAVAGGELDVAIDAVQTFGHAPKKKAA